MAKKMLKHIIDYGGEGLMMRKPKSLYEPGRSSSLLKLKAAQGDAEALVISTRPGVLTLQLPSRVVFEVSQTFTQEISPKKGDVVTFEYDNLVRREAPVNPVVTRIREDVNWEEILSDFSNATTPNEDGKFGFVQKAHKFWSREGYKNLRLFLENFARKRNLDPLMAETWYNTPAKYLEDSEAMNVINQKGGYIKTLMKLFPEINFDPQNFTNMQKGHWTEVGNRRRFFDKLAEEQGFNPLDPANWYSFPSSVIFEKDSNFIITQYYQGNLHKALMHVYPDIGLQAGSFKTQPSLVLDSVLFRRRFFEIFARENKFDPLTASNWYEVDEKLIKLRKNAGMVLRHYQQNIPRALMHIFPNIGLRLDMFSLPRNYWMRPNNRKSFFDNYAKEHGFDPLCATNWHKLSANEVLSVKHTHSVLNHYKGSFKRALLRIYPNIGLRFDPHAKGHWADRQVQKQFFDEFASETKFDPLIAGNWYKVSYYAIVTRKHGQAILANHQSFKNALMAIYPQIGLDKSKFKYVGYYIHKSNRKKYFDNLAQQNGFDPKTLANWHTFGEARTLEQPVCDFQRHKTLAQVLQRKLVAGIA